MTLAAFQKSLKTLLMSHEGSHALESAKAFKSFLSQLPLSDAEKKDLATQPITRLRQYSHMLQTNVDDTLQSVFPITYKILEEDWDELTTHYFWEHPNPSYQLIEAGRSFPDFLLQQESLRETFPFLPELALYEWVEADLLSTPNPVYPKNIQTNVPHTVDALKAFAPVLNDVSTLLQFTYPIPAIITLLDHHPVSELTPQQIQPKMTLLWIYRNNSPYICRFFELNAVLATWLSTVKSNQASPLNYEETIAPVFYELQKRNTQLEADIFYQEFLSILEQLFENGILIGSILR